MTDEKLARARRIWDGLLPNVEDADHLRRMAEAFENETGIPVEDLPPPAWIPEGNN